MAKLKPTYFESIKQCAAMTGIPLHKLKDWKAQGCPAFRYSRVYHADLLQWAKGNDARPGDGNELPKSHWDRERAKVDYERALFNLEVEKHKYVEFDEVCVAVGRMLAGFMTAVRMAPGSAARWLVGLKDFHAIKERLETEMDALARSLNGAHYIKDEELLRKLIGQAFPDQTPEFRAHFEKDLETFHAALGRECFKELQIDVAEPQA